MWSFAFLVGHATVPLLAQTPPRPQPSASPTRAADAAYTIETLRTRVRFENDGTGTREMFFSVKVLDEQAVRQWGQLTLAYQSETEDLAVRHVQVQKPDGSSSSTGDAGVQDLAVPPPGPIPIFLDLRQKAITVSALRPGDLLTVDAVWTTKKPITPGQFWFEHSFETKESVRDELLEIDLPAQRTVSLKVRPGAPAEEHGGAGALASDRRVCRWKSSHMPDPGATPKTPKTPQPGDEQPQADIRLSSFRSWDEFAGWFGALASAGPDAVVKAKAHALTAGAADEAAKVAAIYRYVSTEIRYVSLSFGLGRFAAHPPAEVLAHQYGDCKDKAVLLQALLDAVGVRTVPILINTGRSIADDFASPLEFDHMIALAPRGPDLLKGVWMDATTEVAPLGMLISTLRDKRGLAIDGRTHGRVVRTPADPPFPSVERMDLDGTVNRIGVLSAQVTYTLRGDSELILRAIVRAAPRSALKDIVTAVAGENGLDGDISDVSTTDPGETTNPFQITFHMRKRGYLDWAAPQSEMPGLATIRLGYSKDEDRKDMDRISLGSPRTVRLHASVELPPGYDVDAPQPVKGMKVGLAYSSTYRADGSRLSLDRELVVDAREVPASSFGEYSAVAVMAAADAAQQFKVRGHAIGAPEVPADATADEIYGAAYSAYEAKRYDVAVMLWKRNTEMAPKMGSAWDALGLAYSQLKKYDEAAAAIQQQIALDPYDKRAYKDLGGVLKDAGKQGAAAAAYAKHVELNGLDGDAFKELGRLYSNLNRFREAAAALEKAAGLLKSDAWVQADLASAYFRTKEIDKAKRAIETVMAMSPNVAVRTNVAWQLAEAGVDLNRAAELARDAEKEIAEATARLDLKSLDSNHLDLVERLAWLWDALGWIQFQKGKPEDAERYVHAAWQIAGRADVASHLGQIYEDRSRLADALSFYLTAQALTTNPTPEMIAHVKKLAGGGDLTLMLQSARQMAPSDRTFTVPQKGGAGAAYFLAIVGSDRRPLEVRFSTGSENLRAFGETALKAVRYPVEFPADSPVRLVLGIRLVCDAKQICRGIVDYPSRVKLPK